jgi:predicted ATPase
MAEGLGLPHVKDRTETLLSSSWVRSDDHDRVGLFRNIIQSWRIHRDFQTYSGAAIRQAPVTRYETTVSGDGDNLISVLHTLYTNDRGFRDDVNMAMGAAFVDEFDELVFSPDAADQRVQLRLRWKSLKKTYSSAQLSDGTLRFLWLIAILANPKPPALIAIDEPEIGLHPRMLPIVAEHAAAASKRTQIVFATHSPDFLDAFRETTPEVTVVTSSAGQTVLKTLKGDELKYWLGVYSLGEMHRSGAAEAIG